MKSHSKILLISSVAAVTFGISSFLPLSSQFDNTLTTVSAKSKAKEVTVGPGTYTVGKQINPGRYVITSLSGSGNLIGEKKADINIILGTEVDDDLGQVTSYTSSLKKGAKIKIDGIEQVNFKPVTKRLKSTKFGAGDWVVGKDIKAGRYKISALEGNGNISDNDGDINEILGTESDEDLGQVTHITTDLTEKQVISTNLQQIQLTKED
ncbi:hypothetical protein FEZ51_03270 [Pediococcus stilesii]|uniref:Uncharacterized protein n=1 Tax=Pediococcus stilesii TaxID=331679 RepID=A0A5R9BW61_9LACO|nr:hypothetical protein [Pediococcus stilesii]TLQ04946.1 hypothetical protein FEZ51_03270 [Pediococcus stilesii]